MIVMEGWNNIFQVRKEEYQVRVDGRKRGERKEGGMKGRKEGRISRKEG
jgi:hypothetical protein